MSRLPDRRPRQLSAAFTELRAVHVLTLRVDARAVERFEESGTLLNVRDDGHVIECAFDQSGERGLNPKTGGVSLELGHHAIAEGLRRLGLRSGAGRGLYVPHGRATLGKGVDLGPVPTELGAGPKHASAPTGAKTRHAPREHHRQ